MIKIQQHAITPLILLPHPLIFQIAPRRHPAVHLVPERLDVVGGAERLVELLHGGGVLVAGGEHAEGDLDSLGVGGVDHCGVDFGGGGEGGAGLGG